MYSIALPLLGILFAFALTVSIIRSMRRWKRAREPERPIELGFELESIDRMLREGQISPEEHHRLTVAALARRPDADAPQKGPRGFDVLPSKQS